METNYALQPQSDYRSSYDWGEVEDADLRNPMSGEGAQHPAADFSTVYRLIWAMTRDGDASEERAAIVRGLKMLKEFSERYECARFFVLI